MIKNYEKIKTCSKECTYKLIAVTQKAKLTAVQKRCIACDEKFLAYTKKEKKYLYCFLCRKAKIRINKKIQIYCLQCNQAFSIFPSQLQRKYCSKNCAIKAFTGAGNPMYGRNRRDEKSGMWGKHHSEETKQKFREIALRRPPPSQETRNKLRTWIGKTHTLDTKKKMSESRKKIWEDQTFRDKMKSVFPEWTKIKPNLLEQEFALIIGPQIRYIGNGTWWKLLPNGKRKNPDFKVSNQKKVIEIFGDYWHKNDNPEELINLYKQAGIDCLVIWENEIKKQPQQVIEKVNQFMSC